MITNPATSRSGTWPFAERLLVFDVRQGWEPLCDVLGVAPPAARFLHLNESAALQKGLRRMMTEGVAPLTFDD